MLGNSQVCSVCVSFCGLSFLTNCLLMKKDCTDTRALLLDVRCFHQAKQCCIPSGMPSDKAGWASLLPWKLQQFLLALDVPQWMLIHNHKDSKETLPGALHLMWLVRIYGTGEILACSMSSQEVWERLLSPNFLRENFSLLLGFSSKGLALTTRGPPLPSGKERPIPPLLIYGLLSPAVKWHKFFWKIIF